MTLLARLSKSLAGRVALTVLLFALLAVPYVALNARLTPRYDLGTPLDDAIPFLPWTICLYWSWLLLVGVGLYAARGEAFLRLAASVALSGLICLCGFVLLPAHYPRPSPDDIASPFWRGAIRWLHRTDDAGNTFPSLHVALTTSAALAMRKRRLAWGIAAVLVSLSTLTVKQHFVVDVVGGAAVAWAAHRLVARVRV